MTSCQSSPQPVEIERGGKKYEGSYTTGGGTITVSCAGHTKSTRLGNMGPTHYALAKIVLGEIVDEIEGNK